MNPKWCQLQTKQNLLGRILTEKLLSESSCSLLLELGLVSKKTFLPHLCRIDQTSLSFSMAEDAEPIVPEGPLGDEDVTASSTFGDTSTWQGWFEKNVVLWAATDPWGFLKAIFMILTPFFIISGILSYILLQDIEKREKDKKRRSKKDANTLRARGKPVKSKHRKAD